MLVHYVQQPKARAYQYYLLSRILANLIEIENQDRKGDGFYEDVAVSTRAVEASLIDLYNNGKVIDEWVHDGEEEEEESPKKKSRKDIPPPPDIDDAEFEKVQQRLLESKAKRAAPSGAGQNGPAKGRAAKGRKAK